MKMNVNVETEYAELNATNGWPGFYQKIKSESHDSSRTCQEAGKPQNKILNRYRDVNPYDHSRVVLQRGSTDYINANLIKIERANRQYILTQGPLSNTVSHFWLMVWEQGTKAVLMLNKLIEKKQEKCFQYWPAKIGPDHAMKMTDVGLDLEYVEQEDHSYYLTRILRLTDTESKESRDILHFHYITWPDFGVPSSPVAFLEFLKKVRNSGTLESDVGPAIVHCSAGIGRSGTLCLVDSALVLIEKYGLNSIDVKEILLEMRKYRMGLIQTPEQLRFSYQAIIEGAKQMMNPNSATPEELNHVNNITSNSESSKDMSNDTSSSSEDEEEGPPPSPPPRLDSLRQNGLDRPLPPIPKSESCDVICDEVSVQNNLNGEGSSEDELEEEGTDDDEDDEERTSESPVSDKSEKSEKAEEESKESPSKATELRHRKRVERKEAMAAKVRDMKRRQQVNEQWTQLKRPKTSLRD